jgi:hypothetical protein
VHSDKFFTLQYFTQLLGFRVSGVALFSMERIWFMFKISTGSAVEYTGLCSLRYSKAQKHQEQSCAWWHSKQQYSVRMFRRTEIGSLNTAFRNALRHQDIWQVHHSSNKLCGSL